VAVTVGGLQFNDRSNDHTRQIDVGEAGESLHSTSLGAENGVGLVGMDGLFEVCASAKPWSAQCTWMKDFLYY
jgi:hypothetical protein